MSQTFIIKRRTDKIDDTPTAVDLEQSILDVRKAYSDGTEEEFARFYRRRYRVAESIVLRVLRARDKILELRTKHSDMLADDFAELMHAEHRVKHEFVQVVLRMQQKEMEK
ncbi:hypothetical protein [Paenibacillus tyrfis]|uniref:hypothetical protein n=1 Tax=Paenibacillus tyrfis TaxID=1501230 RepID=UPI00209DC6F4|nr:hypothetical protein [Paenibacillus tyrfis]MCP1306434.1 hypothetical protein [Paenibacillus tyrfis]